MPGLFVHSCVLGTLVIGGSIALSVSALGDQSPTSVAFPAADGYWIHADFYASSQEYRNGAETDAPIIVLVHDSGADRSAWLPLIEPLRRSGAAILVPDLRGHGQSATGRHARTGHARRSDAVSRNAGRPARRVRLAGKPAWPGSGAVCHDRRRDRRLGGPAICGQDCSVDVVVCLSPPWISPV